MSQSISYYYQLNRLCQELAGFGVNTSIIRDGCGITLNPDTEYELTVNIDFKINASNYQHVFVLKTILGRFYTGKTYYVGPVYQIPYELQIILSWYPRDQYGNYIWATTIYPSNNETTTTTSVATSSTTETTTSSYSEEASVPNTTTTTTATSSQEGASEVSETTEQSTDVENSKEYKRYRTIDNKLYWAWREKHYVDEDMKALTPDSREYKDLDRKRQVMLIEWKRDAIKRIEAVEALRRLKHDFDFQRDYKTRFPSEKKLNHNHDFAKTLFSISKNLGAKDTELKSLRKLIADEEKYGAAPHRVPCPSSSMIGAGAETN